MPLLFFTFKLHSKYWCCFHFETQEVLWCWKTLTFSSEGIPRELTELHTDRCVLELWIWDGFFLGGGGGLHTLTFKNCILRGFSSKTSCNVNFVLGQKSTSTAYYWLFMLRTYIYIYIYIYIYSGYGKYSDPLKLFTLCYIAAIC